MRAPRVLLSRDVIVIQRPSGQADAEGDPTGVRTIVGTRRGTLSHVAAREVLAAAERDTIVDKALAVELGTDVQEGDWVTVSGTTYEVVDTENRRLYRRALMRVLN